MTRGTTAVPRVGWRTPLAAFDCRRSRRARPYFVVIWMDPRKGSSSVRRLSRRGDADGSVGRTLRSRHDTAAGGDAASARPDPRRRRRHGRRGAGRSRRSGLRDRGPTPEFDELLEHMVATMPRAPSDAASLLRRGPGFVCRRQGAVRRELGAVRRQAADGDRRRPGFPNGHAGARHRGRVRPVIGGDERQRWRSFRRSRTSTTTWRAWRPARSMTGRRGWARRRSRSRLDRRRVPARRCVARRWSTGGGWRARTPTRGCSACTRTARGARSSSATSTPPRPAHWRWARSAPATGRSSSPILRLPSASRTSTITTGSYEPPPPTRHWRTSTCRKTATPTSGPRGDRRPSRPLSSTVRGAGGAAVREDAPRSPGAPPGLARE